MLYWIIAVPFILFGAYIVFFNCTRHFTIYSNKKAGHYQNISSTPMVGPLFFLVGWGLSPIDINLWMLLIFVFEIATIDFIHDDEDDVDVDESET